MVCHHAHFGMCFPIILCSLREGANYLNFEGKQNISVSNEQMERRGGEWRNI